MTNAASYDATAGIWKINIAAADINGDIVSWAFSLPDCQPITYTISTATVATGTGAYVVTVTVTDGTDPIDGATVRLTKGNASYPSIADANGQVSFSLDEGIYSVSITSAGFTFTPTNLRVSGTESVTYSMDSVDLPVSVLPLVTGTYHTSLDIADVFGTQNLLIWADMDNDKNSVSIARRILSIIQKTESWLNSRFRASSAYKIPFASPAPLEITEICAIQSGARLYEPRSVEDFTTEAGQATKTMVSVKQRRADSLMRDILSDKVRLDVSPENYVQTNVPQVIREIPCRRDFPHCVGGRGEINFSDV